MEANQEPIPGYRLIERLGVGGFGEVWKCHAPGGLQKAIKFVFANAASAEECRELKGLERIKEIRHPFILNVERIDVVDGKLFIVMELADRDLSHRLEACIAQGLPGIPREELLGYMDEAAEALDLMNVEHDVQHLDIKPSNLFLIGGHVKVADFGLAKEFEGVQASVTGGMTPVYAAPETFNGYVTRNTDQYSLAIVYQELLTGARPFPGPSPPQLMMQHLTGSPDLASLPPSDRPIVGRALAKNADERYGSCK
ncbi:MAG TPA: serine/threonine-protein kinase, partial [Planctomycetia bacterium]|nr:serine/threonine-protein kinase [Planctomycetia bacterium]